MSSSAEWGDGGRGAAIISVCFQHGIIGPDQSLYYFLAWGFLGCTGSILVNLDLPEGHDGGFEFLREKLPFPELEFRSEQVTFPSAFLCDRWAFYTL